MAGESGVCCDGRERARARGREKEKKRRRDQRGSLLFILRLTVAFTAKYRLQTDRSIDRSRAAASRFLFHS